MAGGTTVTFDGVIGESPAGSGASLTINTSGTSGTSSVVLNNADTYSGRDDPCGPSGSAPVSVLTVGNGAALGSGPLTVSGLYTIQSNVSTDLSNDFTFGSPSVATTTVTLGAGGNSPLTFSGNGLLTGATVTLTVSNNAGVYFTGALSGPASMAVNGTGTLFLSGNNSYLGGTTLNSTSPVTVVIDNNTPWVPVR